ncbi:Protein of unknown function [Paracoccus alcaliphilus]|uniref:DUF2793 domain-containing protein n=1 Tax=Paracoccus alcaliphilus TaxID=34002 RepID=A0A1H8GAE4_9RHOB|nr:DUF2793 domain-containing protein [Paracoccus alcaliphilus]WCR17919.1 DUF2793 domain-containing protein [Paracoccus alcaliphilus]SEN41006.1 Protein of unknown function [Paracoccus alcaliphilus]
MPTNETMRLGMPLLLPAQAQKHVTVNEALMRLDGQVNLVLQSVSTTTPPETVIDGACWAVPSGAQGDWSGRGGQIAIGVNGGWVFQPPAAGMRAFIADRGVGAIHDGTVWVVGAFSLGIQGSGLIAGMAEAEVAVSAGASFDTGVLIPGGAMVLGAVAKVTEALTGDLQTWQLGTSGAENRFGQGLGKGQGSWARGMLGAPMTYYEPATLIMTAQGGAFAGGRVRLAAHWWELRLPD